MFSKDTNEKHEIYIFTSNLEIMRSNEFVNYLIDEMVYRYYTTNLNCVGSYIDS